MIGTILSLLLRLMIAAVAIALRLALIVGILLGRLLAFILAAAWRGWRIRADRSATRPTAVVEPSLPVHPKKRRAATKFTPRPLRPRPHR